MEVENPEELKWRQKSSGKMVHDLLFVLGKGVGWVRTEAVISCDSSTQPKSEAQVRPKCD
ncbi:hypothetical protein RUM44_006329 [Polyplax serrata]|uniref:Uncharacterized protein n=1 Tax=Polyplax serrata TaxID=468196 RepID=A0ABR1AHU1_POLSC